MKSSDRLTYALISEYGDRKVHGRISVIIDTKSNSVYVVPREEEHIEFISRLLGTEELDPMSCQYLIPSHIQIGINEQTSEQEVQGFFTGVCGLEIGLGARHPKEALHAAHEQAKCFVRKGELPLASPLLEDKVNEKYALK